MLNATLYLRGMKRSVKLLIVLCAVTTMYVWIIISMFEPQMAKMLDGYVDLMPELMSSMGMVAGATTLIGFICSYLYGFVLLVIPMLFCIIEGNALVAKQVDDNSMTSLLAAPLKRRTIILTQLCVMISGILIIDIYTTVLELICANHYFPGELDAGELLLLNVGLLALHLFIGGVCFTASCLFSEVKYSLAFGAGIPILMFVLKMLANMGGNAENVKYATFFSLFQPNEIAAGDHGALVCVAVMFVGAILLYGAGCTVFCKKDLHI